MENIEKLQGLIDKSRALVFFGGAGVSTESGIPDFRSQDGLYNQEYKYPPEVILSYSFYRRNPEEFYRFYRKKMIYMDAKPNNTHLKLAQLEKKGKCKHIITQNIDGLHQLAGSTNVLELHGSVLRNYCEKCGKYYELSCLMDREGIPLCSCGGIIKPDVTLYEEALDQNVTTKSIDAISNADLLIIGGTSLSVYPASGLVDYFKGDNIILINREETKRDGMADYIFRDSIGEFFGQLL